MALEDNLRIVADRIKNHSSAFLTEEAVKTAIVLPILSALGYDIFNPNEVIPEFTADAVGKRGEKVDYAIRIDDKIRILVECKPITTSLEKLHLAQLYRYFSVTSAKFALLTNGRTFNFYSDLEEPNKLDAIPFLSFDLADIQQGAIIELKKFSKNEFDFDGIRIAASKLKYISHIKKGIGDAFENPPEVIVRLFCAGLYDGRFTQAIMEQFSPLTKAAFRDLIRDAVQSRLSSALAESALPEELELQEAAEIVETTAEELEGFHIIKAIVREVVAASRICMRDQKSYCGVLMDNNNRRPLARLHFNSKTRKYISLFDSGKEERVRIETLDNIYDFSNRLRRTAENYEKGVRQDMVELPLSEK